MSRRNNNGLQIGRQADKRPAFDGVTPLLSGVVLFTLALLTGMDGPWLPALSGAAVFLLGRRLPAAAAALPLLFLLAAKTAVFDGFCQWYNGVGMIYTAGSGTVLPALAVSGEDARIFSCWLGAAMGVMFLFFSRLGREAVCVFALILCGGVSLALGKLADPLPMLLAAGLLCAGRGWKRLPVPVGILTAFVLMALMPGFSGWAMESGAWVRQELHTHQYETKYTTLPEGRLESLGQSDAPALVVTMEKPEVLYLRGFTGAVLDSGGWEPLDPQLLAENADLLYWLNSREFDLRAQFEAAASVVETRKNTVTVQNVGACSAYRYIPFTVQADDRLVPENLTETAAGERYDSFTTVYGGAALLPELVAALESAASRYLQAEAAYREFVKANYLSVPEEMTEKMQPWWDKAQGKDAQSAVRAVLEDCYPDGVRRDPFYATAAVLTLRHFGIPARYAEGYIVPEGTETTVELTGRNAACWAEVYQDGVGWVPMALTPGLEGETEQEEQPLPPDTPEETLPPETEPSAEPEPQGGYQVRIAKVFLSGALVLMLLLMLTALALVLRRRYILKKRQAILDREDAREAVTRSFADSISMLERMGVCRGNGSLDHLTAPVRDRFGAEIAAQFAAASQLNSRALFSSHPITEAERQAVRGFREAVVSLLRQSAGRLQRFWMQYILCLF